MKITWNGQSFAPTENGSAVYPLIYDGKVYLPAKSFAEKAGLAISYDAISKNMIVMGNAAAPATAGKPVVAAPVQQVKSVKLESLKPFKGTLNKENLSFQGEKTDVSSISSYASFNLGGKYNKLQFNQFVTDKSINQDQDFRHAEFYCDGEMVAKFDSGADNHFSQTSEESIQKCTVNLNKCKVLVIKNTSLWANLEFNNAVLIP